MSDLMRDNSSKAKIIRISLEYKASGYIFAHSPDQKGLLVAADTLELLEKRIPEAIMDLSVASEEKVFLVAIDALEVDSPVSWWVKVPTSAARFIEFA